MYDLHCKECAANISPAQYDAHLGLCADCFAKEEDLAEAYDQDVCDMCGREMHRDDGDGEDPHPNSCLACSCGMC